MKIFVWIAAGLLVATAAMAQSIRSVAREPVHDDLVTVRVIFDVDNGYTACRNALTPLCDSQDYDGCSDGVDTYYLSSTIVATFIGKECALRGICVNHYRCSGTCIGECRSTNPCPVLVDLENDGIHLTGIADPVWFDIDADGAPDLLSWTDRGEGILALDRNGNGTIDDGAELFGNATPLADGTRAANGYLALAEVDSLALLGNGDGQIDAADAAFGDLRMWTDANHDGVSQPEELQTLEAAGVQSIELEYRLSHRTDRHGNEFRYFGRTWKAGPNGAVHPALTWDVFFVLAP